MPILRVTTRWTGFQGGPGYSNFFFQGNTVGQSSLDYRQRVTSFFNELNTLLPSEVQYQNDPEVPVFDEVTGSLIGYSLPGTQGTPGIGGMTGGYSAASGAVITWNTDSVRGSRRIRGRTFIVPLGGTAYQNDGTLTTSTITALQDAAGELIQGGPSNDFVIWSRPVGGAGGIAAPVTGYRIPDMSAVLRSRRD